VSAIKELRAIHTWLLLSSTQDTCSLVCTEHTPLSTQNALALLKTTTMLTCDRLIDVREIPSLHCLVWRGGHGRMVLYEVRVCLIVKSKQTTHHFFLLLLLFRFCSRYCLARPDVRFSLRSTDPNDSLVKPASATLREAIRVVFKSWQSWRTPILDSMLAGEATVGVATVGGDGAGGAGEIAAPDSEVKLSGFFPSDDKAMMSKTATRSYVTTVVGVLCVLCLVPLFVCLFAVLR
jgi:hypothetical protein